jgi:hypothetical protein
MSNNAADSNKDQAYNRHHDEESIVFQHAKTPRYGPANAKNSGWFPTGTPLSAFEALAPSPAR